MSTEVTNSSDIEKAAPANKLLIARRPWSYSLIGLQVAGAGLSAAIISLWATALSPGSVAIYVVVPIIYGYFFGQFTLAALATTFGPWSLLVRLTAPPLLIGVQIVLIFLALTDEDFEIGVAMLIAAVGLVFWMVAQSPLWLARRLLRLQLLHSNDLNQASDDQFTIRQLLIFTLVISMVLGLGRIAIKAQALDDFLSFRANDLIAFAMTVAAVTVTALLTIFYILRGRNLLADVAISTGAVAIVAAVLYFAIRPVMSQGLENDALLLSLCIGGQHIWTSANLVAVRAAGYRLLRGA